MNPIPVLIETPYSGNIEENIEFALKCMTAAYQLGFAPVLTHLLWTRNLEGNHVPDDSIKDIIRGREYALVAARSLRKNIGLTFFVVDKGISSGMKRALEEVKEDNIPYEIFEFKDFSSISKKFL